MKKKILLMTNHLYQGGVDKVVIDIANGLNKELFDVTILVVFRFKPERFQIDDNIKVKGIFRFYFKGFKSILSLIPAGLLYKVFVREKYDYEIAFQAGIPTVVLSHSTNKTAKRYAWVHGLDMINPEANKKFDKNIFVSESVKNYYQAIFDSDMDLLVKYNPIDNNNVFKLSKEDISKEYSHDAPILCTVGRLSKEKGLLRLLEIHKRLLDNKIQNILWIIGEGAERPILEKYISINHLQDTVTLWGYQKNPYNYIASSDVYVCSSYNEGLSVAATEAILLEKPVVTTDVFGMEELLGSSEYGIITENNTDALFNGIEKILSGDNIKYFTEMARIRSRSFCQVNRMLEIEKLFED